ncbi:MAG: HlyC/CorC family transporter [Cycloclasticus pugetii]|jgi:magnesium and cobalt transporter|uniref:Magnesium and cobalt efflux protein CorC n=2 Tax=Cycloclasticus TaxID=34067 RepID=S5TVU1_9GAMM|nr:MULTISPECIES: transporter associated domain-containing protein [Cycloclasticus]AFT67703.1 Mg2+/Co2+ transporter [Cycloclasticus sp. P1]AGS39128.1 Mg2+ and Co2+ transporter CorC [Cycloclasticus zancles 78-ME]ATI02754.1 CBS domain-containing protein [Cycloclasticus sp. PY97N]EPD13498.1 Mg2+/Co2+ transporter [Cycloclasticus pugetii]MDF1828789.1 transporter associated domain-containing protein [Cycloclasticus pugetii]
MNQTKNDTLENRSWIERLGQALMGEPKDREDLVQLMRDAEKRDLLGQDALAMIEGVLQVSELQVRDIMIPRSQIVFIPREAELKDIFPRVTESAHSRFPVQDEETSQVAGILLAKDLLNYVVTNKDEKFDVKDVMRPAIFVPESKRLNVMLHEFRANRNHMAIVIDEYGSVAGLITIEDVLEQIVGEIEDEHDFEEEAFILQRSEYEYNIKALTEIADFNERFETDYPDDVDTVGGMVVKSFGHVPEHGEKTQIDGFLFEVLRADNRRVHLLRMTILDAVEEE